MNKWHDKKRNNRLGIFLIILFSYNAIFCHITLWAWKIYMQEELEELAQSMNNDELFHISFPYTEKPQHEIAYNGKMYDVIRFTITENTIHYWCIQDFAETLIAASDNAPEIISKAHEKWTHHAKTIAKKQFQLFVLLVDKQFPAILQQPKLAVLYLFNPNSNTFATPTPPPKQMVQNS
jgi:hypothetical protein